MYIFSTNVVLICHNNLKKKPLKYPNFLKLIVFLLSVFNFWD